MNSLYEIQELMDSIMRMMDDGSHYDEFEPEFLAVDDLIESLEEEHASLCQATYDAMLKSLKEGNNSLERSYNEMLAFQEAIDSILDQLNYMYPNV
jgi:hypothetical protein